MTLLTKFKKRLIENGKWRINGKVTYPGTKAEGLLMNVRMVNSTFEDRERPDFDPDANTQAFIDKIPDYTAQGVRAFTLLEVMAAVIINLSPRECFIFLFPIYT